MTWLLLSTVGICFLSAVFPLVNAEAYMAATVALHPTTPAMWAIAGAASVGQTLGKIAFYKLGEHSLNWKWVQKKTETEKWKARMELWSTRIHGNKTSAAGLLLASSVLGVPPLAIIAVVAGQLKAPFALFVGTVFIGRWARFAAVVFGVGALSSLWPW